MDLSNAAVVVTGGRGGLGSKICEAFLAEGARVMAMDIVPVDSGRMVAGAPHVLVNAVAPGLMEGTGMTVNLSQEFIDGTKEVSALGRSTKLEDVAAQIVAFARSDTITGQTVPVDAGVVFH